MADDDAEFAEVRRLHQVLLSLLAAHRGSDDVWSADDPALAPLWDELDGAPAMLIVGAALRLAVDLLAVASGADAAETGRLVEQSRDILLAELGLELAVEVAAKDGR